MVDFSQKFIFVALLPKSQSHLQMQCCQCVVGCQCLSNVVCSFCSNFITLRMVDFQSKVYFSQCCQNHNLTAKFNSVNVLLFANASPICFAPSAPISLRCECDFSQ